MRCAEYAASGLGCSDSMYLSAELVAEGFRAILFLVVVPYDDATALRKGFHHELQRFLVAKDLFALLLELRVDLLLEKLLASCRLRSTSGTRATRQTLYR